MQRILLPCYGGIGRRMMVNELNVGKNIWCTVEDWLTDWMHSNIVILREEQDYNFVVSEPPQQRMAFYKSVRKVVVQVRIMQ